MNDRSILLLLHHIYYSQRSLNPSQEIHSLTNGKPAQMVSFLYALPEGNYQRGYKAPNDIRTPAALEALRKYWPETKLIVGLRHPVKWFESYYNFHARHGKKDLPPAETMVGPNLPDQVKYHIHLSGLGKTNVTDPGEAALLGVGHNKIQPASMSNPVFLFEVGQPFSNDEALDEQYRIDLSDFLGLSRPLPPIPEQNYVSRNKDFALNICDQKYDHLRDELVANGKNAAAWIQNYFMDHPDVTVSSPDQLVDLLSGWSVDPCTNKQNTLNF